MLFWEKAKQKMSNLNPSSPLPQRKAMKNKVKGDKKMS